MPQAKFFVKKVVTCPNCEGRQFVQHPAWTEYWKENADKPFMTADQDRKWFEDHGWYVGSCIDIRINGIPDEEVVCGECEGNGEIITEVDLATILPALLLEIQVKG